MASKSRTGFLKRHTMGCALVALWMAIAPQSLRAQEVGKVFGSVFMPYEFEEALMPGASIQFLSRNTRFEVAADQEGRYEVSLPVGKYQVTARQAGFCAVPRAEFTVTVGTQT